MKQNDTPDQVIEKLRFELKLSVAVMVITSFTLLACVFILNYNLNTARFNEYSANYEATQLRNHLVQSAKLKSQPSTGE